MDVKVIDVSKHNGAIDFEKVAAEGIYGVIIRAGFGRAISQKDVTFEKNYEAAKAAGLKVGAYWYSYANTVADAALEASVFYEVINGKEFELPIYYDIEEASQLKLGKEICSAMADTFCSFMERKGYFAGLYSYDSFFFSNLTDDVKKKYTCWVARVENVKPKYYTGYDMWQYTFKLKLDGILGVVDCSHLYRDFESIIKSKKLNGFCDTPKYNVTAHIAGLEKAKADKIAESVKKLGMTVVIAEGNGE